MLRVEKDSESLIVHRDQYSSSRSLFTDEGSKLSLKFDFDKFLFTTEVYASHIRNSPKTQVRNQFQDSATSGDILPEGQSGVVSPEARSLRIQSSTSARIEKRHWVQKWRRTAGEYVNILLRPDRQLLLLGTSCSDRATLMTLVDISCEDDCSSDQLGRYRPAVYRALIDYAKLLLETLQGHYMELVPGIDQEIFHKILHYDTLSGPLHHLDEQLIAALTTLWKLPGLHTALERSECAFPEKAL